VVSDLADKPGHPLCEDGRLGLARVGLGGDVRELGKALSSQQAALRRLGDP
jgi:hypothetical protein